MEIFHNWSESPTARILFDQRTLQPMRKEDAMLFGSI